MKVTNTNNVSAQKIKAIIYGLSGNGKTTLAKTLTEYSPLILSLEGGLLSLAGTNINVIDMTLDDEGKLVPVVSRHERIKEAYKFLLTDEAKSKYKTIFIDSLTEIAQAIHAMVLSEFPDRKDALPMWGAYNTRMRELIRAFRDIPGYHVVFTCLSRIEKDETTGKKNAAFDCQGGIADRLPGFMDLVMYLKIDSEGKRELLCHPTDSVLAKDRSSKLAKVEPADLGFIFNKILNEKS